MYTSALLHISTVPTFSVFSPGPDVLADWRRPRGGEVPRHAVEPGRAGGLRAELELPHDDEEQGLERPASDTADSVPGLTRIHEPRPYRAFSVTRAS